MASTRSGEILQRLRQEAHRESWIFGVSLEHLGGERGGARVEAVAAHGLPAGATETLSAAIAAITLDAARAVIAQDLQVARMVLMLGGRQPDTAAAFAAAGMTRFQTVVEEPSAAGSH